jgi:proteasome-associated ATPase
MSTENDVNNFETLLPAGPEPVAHLEARLALIGPRRKESRETNEALDRFLVERCAQLTARNASLETQLNDVNAIQAELRVMLDQAMSAPWFPGVFLRSVETTGGPLAEVFHGDGRRLVHLGNGVNGDDLTAGQVVYLGQERNAVLDVAPGQLPEAGEIATVERMLDDGRALLRDRDAQVLVHTAQALRDADVAPGDSVRWSRELALALEPVEASAPSELFVSEHISAQPAQRLGGLAREIEQIISLFTQSIAQPEVATRYGLTGGNTLLLHGPPGNGKTSIARIVGSALAAATGEQCRFASVKGAQLESPWVGTTQQNVRELFRELSRDARPTVLFLDEVDAMGRNRGGLGGHHSDKFLSAWLTEIDGLERRHGSLGIIASSNRKDLIDQALLERLSGMELFIGRPSLETAREIFAIHLLPTLPYGPNGAEAERTREDIIETAVGTLYSPNADNAIAELRFRDGSARTIAAREILSGRAIEQICVHARRDAFRRHTEGGTRGVRVEDMQAAVAHTLDRLASTLSPGNASALLSDLPQDVDVVAVKPVRRKVAAHRYFHRSA